MIEITSLTPMLHVTGWQNPGASSVENMINQRQAAFKARLLNLQTNEVIWGSLIFNDKAIYGLFQI
ncbi:hypothetical protein [Nitrosomonas sp. Nm34]|uniref:hypothetical protein n=1 Tax=Nitrosomonas sp. Nm34 TaxID=1881055 RepID=UPI001113648C|nr:hypothetical protein [Nitrosomonas sp. Nm34]